MKITIHEQGGQKIAEVASDSVIINNEQDALDLMVEPALAGAKKIIIYQKNIVPGFFDLGTRLAGEILQKFVNYRVKLAVVGDFKNVESDSLKAFIYESNRGNQIFFLDDLETAKTRLFAAN
jgi:hypothetical protein